MLVVACRKKMESYLALAALPPLPFAFLSDEPARLCSVPPFPSLRNGMTAYSPLTVLAVDDNRTNLHILKVFLKKLGHRVITAENGEQALHEFSRNRPDIILLDIMMPILDGFEVARRIKSMTQDYWVPIIFLSALNRDENLVEGLEAGGDDYLTKPINFVVLEAKMRSMQRALLLQQRAVDSLHRVQAVSDNVMEAIITIDPEQRIVACNVATEKLFVWPAAELIGESVSRLLPDSFLPSSPPTDAESSGRHEVAALRQDGSRFPAEVSVSEIRLEEGTLFIAVVRDITERKRTEQKLRDNARQLQSFYDQTQIEQRLASELMEKQLHRRGLQDPAVRYAVWPAQRFSGDIVAAMRSDSGRLYALMADATGHGLSAAISVLPVLAIFYRLAACNQALAEMVAEINQQLRESVPVGRYVAATLLCLDADSRQGEIWNGGMPGTLLVDDSGVAIQTFISTQTPLGIVPNAALDCRGETFTLPANGQLVLCSDGLLEAENAAGEQFGAARLESAIAGRPMQTRFDAITAALSEHLLKSSAGDDISIMLIDC